MNERVNPLTAYFQHYAHFNVIHTVPARHCRDAWSLIIETKTNTHTHPDHTTLLPLSLTHWGSKEYAFPLPVVRPASISGWKIVFSGDTEATQTLVDAGWGATVLVHEATLADHMIKEARDKKHSTMRQAIAVGERMQAARILLTHFSQRYPKLPIFSSNMTTSTTTSSTTTTSSSDGETDGATPSSKSNRSLISLTFDLQIIGFSELHHLPLLNEPYAWLFPNDEDGDDGTQERSSQDS